MGEEIFLSRYCLDIGKSHPVLPVGPKKVMNGPRPQRQRHCWDGTHLLILWLPVQGSPHTEGPSGQGPGRRSRMIRLHAGSLFPSVTLSKLPKPLQAYDNQGFSERKRKSKSKSRKSKKPTWQVKPQKNILEKHQCNEHTRKSHTRVVFLKPALFSHNAKLILILKQVQDSKLSDISPCD